MQARPNLPDIIKAIMKRKNISMNGLARLLYALGDTKADASYVSKLLRGKYKSPGIDRVGYIAQALEVPLSELVDAPAQPGMEDVEMAKRIAILIPQLENLSDPVEFMRDVAALPAGEQEDVESYVEFKKFKQMTLRQRREYIHAQSVDGSVNILGSEPLKVAEPQEEYKTQEE